MSEKKRFRLANLLLGLTMTAPLCSALAQFTPQGSQFQVNGYTPGLQSFSDIGPDGAGGFVLVWQSNGSGEGDTSGNSIQARRYSSWGMPLGPQFQVNTQTISNQNYPAVGSDGASGFVVAWSSPNSLGGDTMSTSIQAQRFASSGAPLGPQFQVNSYTTSSQSYPTVGPDGSGGFLIAWESNGSSEGDLSGNSIQGQRYLASGSQNGLQFQVNTYTTSGQKDATLSLNGAGGFLIAWTSSSADGDLSGNSVQAQHFASSGAAVGLQFQVNTYTTGNQETPAIGLDGTGGFVIIWESTDSSEGDLSGSSIHARRYTTLGPLAPQFQVNTHTTGGQSLPSVSQDGASGFVITWESASSPDGDVSSSSIHARRFSASGPAIGFQFQVNTYTTSIQQVPEVAPDGAGGFLISWSSIGSAEGDTSSSSIQAQRYGPPPAPTWTATGTVTSTPTVTHTFTPTATSTLTATPTRTSTNTFTATSTQTSTVTSTFTPTLTATSTATPSATQTFPSTSTTTSTFTPTRTATSTATGTSTNSPTPTGSFTATFSSSETPTPSPTPGLTSTETATATLTATATSSGTGTTTPSATASPPVLVLSGQRREAGVLLGLLLLALGAASALARRRFSPPVG